MEKRNIEYKHRIIIALTITIIIILNIGYSGTDIKLPKVQVKESKEACMNLNDDTKEKNAKASEELREGQKVKEKLERD